VSQNSKFFAPQMMYVIMQIKHVKTKHTLIYTSNQYVKFFNVTFRFLGLVQFRLYIAQNTEDCMPISQGIKQYGAIIFPKIKCMGS